jgi:hypothetical protein
MLEPRMTSLQPLLEIDRHEYAHLAGLVDPELGDLIGLQFLLVHPQPEADIGRWCRPLVRHGHARLNPLETLGLTSARCHLDHDFGTAQLRVVLPPPSALPKGDRDPDRADDDSNNPHDKSGIHEAGLPDLVARKPRRKQSLTRAANRSHLGFGCESGIRCDRLDAPEWAGKAAIKKMASRPSQLSKAQPSKADRTAIIVRVRRRALCVKAHMIRRRVERRPAMERRSAAASASAVPPRFESPWRCF